MGYTTDLTFRHWVQESRAESSHKCTTAATALCADNAAGELVTTTAETAATTEVTLKAAIQADTDAATLLVKLNTADADVAQAAALADETLQTGEATDADTAAAQALATEGLVSDEVNRITGVRDAAQGETDAEADAAEAELEAAEDALDELNP